MMNTNEPTMEEEAARELANLIEDLAELDAEFPDQPDQVQDWVFQWPLAIEALTTIRVTLGTGGPARGIDFKVTEGRYGYEMESATFWHQDWFQPKGHVEMDESTALRLFYMWGLEEYNNYRS